MKKIYNDYIKRFCDLVLSLIGIIISSPIFLIVAVAIKIDSRGPVLFKQDRIGKDGKVFKIYKFMSMIVGAENTGSKNYSFKETLE